MSNRMIDPTYEPHELIAPVPGNITLPRDPSRLQVAVFFDNVAGETLATLDAWRNVWGQHYDPKVLAEVLGALKRMKELVNR